MRSSPSTTRRCTGEARGAPPPVETRRWSWTEPDPDGGIDGLDGALAWLGARPPCRLRLDVLPREHRLAADTRRRQPVRAGTAPPPTSGSQRRADRSPSSPLSRSISSPGPPLRIRVSGPVAPRRSPASGPTSWLLPAHGTAAASGCRRPSGRRGGCLDRNITLRLYTARLRAERSTSLPSRAAGGSSTTSSTASGQSASWSNGSGSASPAFPSTCACCARPVSSMCGRTPSAASTGCGPSRCPRSPTAQAPTGALLSDRLDALGRHLDETATTEKET